MFYEQLFSTLNRCGVRYAVAGGLAVNLHGIPRMTADVDLVVDLHEQNLQSFLKAMTELGFHPRLPVAAEALLDAQTRRDWVQNRHLHAFSFWSADRQFQEVDLLLAESEVPGIFERVQTYTADSIEIPVVSIEDLISMKQRANRAQDKSDIAALQQLDGG